MASTKTEEKVSKASKNRNKQLTLEIVKENWEIYVKQLKKNVAQMLYFQMQQVVPVQLKNGELFLSCNDAFTKKMVSEHKKELAKILEGVIGSFLHISCSVRVQQKNETERSPYERFKKLQQDDPIVKRLIELFGAELDYNL